MNNIPDKVARFILIIGFVFGFFINSLNFFDVPNFIFGIEYIKKAEDGLTLLLIAALSGVLAIRQLPPIKKKPIEPPRVERSLSGEEVGSLFRVKILRLTRPVTTGPEVRRLQKALKDKGCDIKIDGRYGHKTKQCVEEFQHKNKITVDGVAGPETHWKLSINLPNTKNK